jgi:hypothetical protein
MKQDFENINYSEHERLAMLENRAAELERRLEHVTSPHGSSSHHAQDHAVVEFEAVSTGRHAARQQTGPVDGPAEPAYHYVGGESRPMVAPVYPDTRTGRYPAAALADYPATAAGDNRPAGAGGYRDPTAVGYPDAAATGYPDAGVGGPDGPDERTEVLINRGRQHASRRGLARWLAHWRAIAIGAAAVIVGAILIAVILPGASASWPASVATVQSEISLACQNPNVVSEPGQVNFACAKDTRQILWVFSLLTSGDNPGFTDSSNGRKGLEPITPAQGGDIAWSLNLHHPYDPASPIDSLQVAARAIDNIIGGATLTGSNGAPVVQPGLESNPANCARYTGSSALVTRQGFPALCALPVNSASGQAALVNDVFQQWMVGTPPQIATEAGVLFQNAGNPGNPRVQAILNSLPDSGL